MIGKDMTKMTLPVSFNEPTSLLQRVTEDMVGPFLCFTPTFYESHVLGIEIGVAPLAYVSCEPHHCPEHGDADL